MTGKRAFSLRLSLMKFNYEIVFSKRRSVSVAISRFNKITLRCPYGFPRARAEKFLADKSAWIEKVIKSNEINFSGNKDIISYKKIFLNGVKVPLSLGCVKRYISSEGVFVKDIKDVFKLYRSAFSNNFLTELEIVAQNCGMTFSSVKIKSYKSRWGCCDGKNNLSFDFKIFMLPERIRNYIVIHELCHTVQHNHSEKFWSLVGGYIPDYKKIRKELANFDFLTSLY